jgi:formylglycine-generating enzyme required for sulfatase activity
MKKAGIFLLLGWMLQMSYAQRTFKTVTNEGSEKRLALVIDNALYQGKPLTNPINDARAVRKALEELGFTVHYYENLGKVPMEAALLRYANELRRHNVVLFYFAGHGFESKDKINYLMSTDVSGNLNEPLAKEKSLSLDVVIESMKDANPRTNLLIVDACRNNPFRSWGRSDQKGLGSINPPLGTVVFFAGSPGQEVDDNATSKNGLFTEEFLTQLRTPNLELTQMLKNTSRAVYKRSGTQVPALTGTLLDDFYFWTTPKKPNPSRREEPVLPKDLPVGPEMAFVRGGSFDMGSTEGEADEKLVHTVTVSPFRMAKYKTTVAETNYRTDAEKEGSSKLWNSTTNTFYDSTGIHWHHGADGVRLLAANYNHPVVHVSHNDALAYCEWLSRKTGRTYRLPTEAEWEYAAGNGLKHSKYSWGTSEHSGVSGNVADQSFKTAFDGKLNYTGFTGYTDGYAYTAPVGKFKANEFGLYDMTGNVWEWCSDWYGADYYTNSSSSNPTGATKGSNRVLRGGSWSDNPAFSRVANRSNSTPSIRNDYVGFRVVSLQ